MLLYRGVWEVAGEVRSSVVGCCARGVPFSLQQPVGARGLDYESMDERALTELLECSVCLEQLDATSKVLQCQHTFCRRCLEEIVATKNELRCPECRMLVEMRVEDLPSNILLIRLLEGLKNCKAGITGQSSSSANSSPSHTQPPSPGSAAGGIKTSPSHKVFLIMIMPAPLWPMCPFPLAFSSLQAPIASVSLPLRLHARSTELVRRKRDKDQVSKCSSTSIFRDSLYNLRIYKKNLGHFTSTLTYVNYCVLRNICFENDLVPDPVIWLKCNTTFTIFVILKSIQPFKMIIFELKCETRYKLVKKEVASQYLHRFSFKY